MFVMNLRLRIIKDNKCVLRSESACSTSQANSPSVKLGNYFTILQIKIKFCNVTQTILNPPGPEIRHYSHSSHPVFVIVDTHLPTTTGWKPKFWVEPRASCITVIHEWTCTHAARELALLPKKLRRPKNMFYLLISQVIGTSLKSAHVPLMMCR